MTSHEPNTQQEIRAEAPPSHKDNPPEGAANKKKSAGASTGKGKSTETQQKRFLPALLSRSKQKKQEQSAGSSQSVGTSKTGTFIEVAAGTILTVVIELIRLRRKQ
jgi:hypothetical protein